MDKNDYLRIICVLILLLLHLYPISIILELMPKTDFVAREILLLLLFALFKIILTKKEI